MLPYNREKCSHQHSHVWISPGDCDRILGVTQHGTTWNGAKWARNTAWRTGVAASGAEEDRRVSSEGLWVSPCHPQRAGQLSVVECLLYTAS